MNETRKLTTILAADVAGYSRLAGLDEEGTLSQLRGLRSSLIDPTISLHRGRVVKRAGDGILVEFRSPVEAVRCALEVQKGMTERNADLPSDRRIEFRIGIHLGDVVEEADGDLMGDAVNIAARLEAIAQPGGMILSDDAYRQVLGKINDTFADLGEQTLKNIARPVRVYGQVIQGMQTAEAPKPTLALPDKPSLAVLPFQNISGDPEQDYFADGMVEDIITGLARINWLFVIARNSSFAYRGKSPDIRQVGRELGVRYVMEGSVRKGGNRLRINCQLIEAESGTHVWADRYDGALEDVFDLQDRITESVVGVIEPNVRRAEIERARRKRPESLRAYDLHLRALPYFASDMPEDAGRGVEFLEQALALEPNYAPAHAFLAWGMEMRVVRGGFNEADAQAGLHHARAALAAPTDDATSLAVASFVVLHLGHDFDLAANSIERAIALNGSCATAFYFGSHIHALSGNVKIAEDYAQRALRLSPFDPFVFEAYIALGMVRLRAGQDDDAAAYFAKGVHANPHFSTLYAMLSAALALAGRTSEAKAAAARLIELEPGFRVAPLIKMASGFAVPSLLGRWSEGLLKAGLPE